MAKGQEDEDPGGTVSHITSVVEGHDGNVEKRPDHLSPHPASYPTLF